MKTREFIMKKKLAVYIMLFLGSTISVAAQNAENDATWEETISFISRHLEYLNKGRAVTEYDMYLPEREGSSFVLDQFNQSRKNKLFCSWGPKEEWHGRQNSAIVDLLKLKDVYGSNSNFSGNGIMLKCSGDYIEGTSFRIEQKSESLPFGGTRTWPEKKVNKYKTDYITLYVEDDEMYGRIKKAFQHLAFLATNQREAARRTSGEKF